MLSGAADRLHVALGAHLLQDYASLCINCIITIQFSTTQACRLEALSLLNALRKRPERIHNSSQSARPALKSYFKSCVYEIYIANGTADKEFVPLRAHALAGTELFLIHLLKQKEPAVIQSSFSPHCAHASLPVG